MKSKILHSKEFLREFEKFLHKLFLESHKSPSAAAACIITICRYLDYDILWNRPGRAEYKWI